MNTLTPAIAALAAFTALTATPATAAPTAAGGHVMVCTRSGHVSLHPALTATAVQNFSFTERGEFSHCNAPDGQVLSTQFAHEAGRGYGRCGSVAATIPAAVLRWSNGQTSTISADGSIQGALAVVDLEVISGQFAGAVMRATAILTPADPSGCVAGGLSETDYVGEIRFTFPS